MEEPLFARSLFLRVDSLHLDISPIAPPKGVVNLARQRGVPFPIPGWVMDALFEAVDESSELRYLSETQAPTLAPETPVTVLLGPFAGMEAGCFKRAFIMPCLHNATIETKLLCANIVQS